MDIASEPKLMIEFLLYDPQGILKEKA